MEERLVPQSLPALRQLLLEKKGDGHPAGIRDVIRGQVFDQIIRSGGTSAGTFKGFKEIFEIFHRNKPVVSPVFISECIGAWYFAYPDEPLHILSALLSIVANETGWLEQMGEGIAISMFHIAHTAKHDEFLLSLIEPPLLGRLMECKGSQEGLGELSNVVSRYVASTNEGRRIKLLLFLRRCYQLIIPTKAQKIPLLTPTGSITPTGSSNLFEDMANMVSAKTFLVLGVQYRLLLFGECLEKSARSNLAEWLQKYPNFNFEK